MIVVKAMPLVHSQFICQPITNLMRNLVNEVRAKSCLSRSVSCSAGLFDFSAVGKNASRVCYYMHIVRW